LATPRQKGIHRPSKHRRNQNIRRLGLIRELMPEEDADGATDTLLAASQQPAGPVTPASQLALYAEAAGLHRAVQGRPATTGDLMDGPDQLVASGLLAVTDQETADFAISNPVPPLWAPTPT